MNQQEFYFNTVMMSVIKRQSVAMVNLSFLFGLASLTYSVATPYMFKPHGVNGKCKENTKLTGVCKCTLCVIIINAYSLDGLLFIYRAA